MGEEQMGWCQVASQIWKSTKAECDEVHGNWTEEQPGICIVATSALGSAAREPSVSDLRTLRDRVIERDPTAAQLANRYGEQYVRVAGPIVALMQQDPVVRQIVTTIAVRPAVEFLRVAALSSTPGSDDGAVRAMVDQGVQRLTGNLTTLGGGDERGEEFTDAVLTTLREVLGDPAAEMA